MIHLALWQFVILFILATPGIIMSFFTGWVVFKIIQLTLWGDGHP